MKRTLMSLGFLMAVACGGSGGKAAPTTPSEPSPADAAPAAETATPTEKEQPVEPAPPAFGRNLKIIPPETPKEQVLWIMKEGISAALGVKCDFCHDETDYALDTNEHKLRAREMMLMTQEIAQKNFKGEYKVTCLTCHNGKPKPVTE